MAPITWDWLIVAARRGEPQLLCDFLNRCDGHFSKAHCRDLSELVCDALTGKLGRPRHRVKLSPETRALVLAKRHLHAQVILNRLRDLERRQGKQLRGKKRDAAFRKIRKSLPPAFRRTTYDDVARLAKRAKSRR
jgi:hypothetical protein